MNNRTDLKKRVIPIILINNYQVVTTRNFADYRVFGNLEQTIEIFNRRDVDEIIVLDISCSKSKSLLDFNILQLMSKNTLMPFSYGGGINSLNDIEKCLNLGCDKVSLNNIIRKDKNFLNMAVNEFGTQAIVVSIDYVLENNIPFIYDHVSSKKLDEDFHDFLSFVHDQSCGEILLSSVNNNGFLKGYDLTVLKKYRDKIDCPIITNGGCGSAQNMVDAFEGGSDACGAGSIFYYTKYGYKDIKDVLREKKIKVR
tara:strand:+ start:63 stop:827 length:765 start_codon:yes stop_codon:yes gene_type:complete